MHTPLESEIRWPRKVRTAADAVRFIDAVGYCLLFPSQNLPLPSLYFAVARRYIRLGPQWDKYCAKIWDWKDELGHRRRACYAKYFRGRGTFISLELLPHFLAMHETAVAAGDHECFYAAGRIGPEARAVWEALARYGPLATLELRHACKMDSTAANLRFKRAMLELQRLVLVVHFGAEQETVPQAGWPSGRFELTWRAFPHQAAAARRIKPEGARASIAAKYLLWHPDAPPTRLGQLFGWSRTEAAAAAERARNPGCYNPPLKTRRSKHAI